MDFISPLTAILDSSAATTPPTPSLASSPSNSESVAGSPLVSTPSLSPLVRQLPTPRWPQKTHQRHQPSWHTTSRKNYYHNNDNNNNDENRSRTTPFDLEDLIFLPDDDDDPDCTAANPIPSTTFDRIGVAMSSAASPIDISTPRASPPTQTSNLTTQLQAASANNNEHGLQAPSNPVNMERRGSEFRSDLGRHGSLVPGTSFHSRPISMRDRQHRESNAMAGSMMGGMSWGGLSVGSFIRDEYVPCWL